MIQTPSRGVSPSPRSQCLVTEDLDGESTKQALKLDNQTTTPACPAPEGQFSVPLQ